MNGFFSLIVATALALGGEAPLTSAPVVQASLGPVTILGNGCANGTGIATVLGKNLVVSFPEVKAVASPGKVVSLSCSIRIGITPKPGTVVELSNFNVSGKALTPQKASGDATARLSAGDQTETLKKSVRTGSWVLNQQKKPISISGCGQSQGSVFGVNLNVIARARGSAQPASLTITGNNAKLSSVSFTITERKC